MAGIYIVYDLLLRSRVRFTSFHPWRNIVAILLSGSGCRVVCVSVRLVLCVMVAGVVIIDTGVAVGMPGGVVCVSERINLMTR